MNVVVDNWLHLRCKLAYGSGISYTTIMNPQEPSGMQTTNWSGVCDKLTRVSSPTLIISGTDDNSIPTANSLIIAAKIPGAWLVHIKDASHSLMDQYPGKFNKVLQTFLSTTTNPG